MKINIELGGGMELLFDNQKTLVLDFPDKTEMNMGEVIKFLADNYVRKKKDLFIVNDYLKPGILVFINSTDWELEGTHDYMVKDKDTISFVSTLHGG